MQRHDSPEAKQKRKDVFTVSKVHHTDGTLDAAAAKILHELYETTIDYGAHPNERGLLASMRWEETEDALKYQVGILHPESLLMTVTLKTAIEVAIGTPKVSQLVAPTQLKVEALDLTIEQLIREVPRTFHDGK